MDDRYQALKRLATTVRPPGEITEVGLTQTNTTLSRPCHDVLVQHVVQIRGDFHSNGFGVESLTGSTLCPEARRAAIAVTSWHIRGARGVSLGLASELNASNKIPDILLPTP